MRQASALAELLAARDAEPVVIPAIEIVPPASYAALDEALQNLQHFDWAIFTSANAVEVFAARRVNKVAPAKIAAIGPATGKAIEALGLHVDLLPEKFVAESLVEALANLAAGKRVLLIRAEEARDVLPDALNGVGVEVTIAPAYRNRVPDASITAIRELLGDVKKHPDMITLTSTSTMRSLLTMLDASEITLPKEIPLASIGPITSEAVREAGYVPAIEAREATIPALVEAVARYFEGKS